MMGQQAVCDKDGLPEVSEMQEIYSNANKQH